MLESSIIELPTTDTEVYESGDVIFLIPPWMQLQEIRKKISYYSASNGGLAINISDHGGNGSATPNQVALFLAMLLIIVLITAGAIKDKFGQGNEWRSVGSLARLAPGASPCPDQEALTAALDRYMKGSSTSPGCARSEPIDQAETWSIIARREFAIQIENPHGRRAWVISEWLLPARN